MVETTDVKKFQNRPVGTIRTLLLEAKKGRGKELMDILLKLVEPTRNEEGNIAYVPHYNIDNPDKILFDEIWMSKVDLDSHFKLPHMVGLLEKISYLLAKPLVLESYEEVRGGVCDYLSYQPNTVDARDLITLVICNSVIVAQVFATFDYTQEW